MKKTQTLLLLITMLLVAHFSVSQGAKYYDNRGVLIQTEVNKIDSSYIKSLPLSIDLTNLTKADLRVFKNLMLAKVQASDKPYDAATKKVFDKIMSDLQTKYDTVSRFKILNIPVNYLTEYLQSNSRSYEDFVRVRKDARQYLRIVANLPKIDTSFYWVSSNNSNIDKELLKKDLKIKP